MGHLDGSVVEYTTLIKRSSPTLGIEVTLKQCFVGVKNYVNGYTAILWPLGVVSISTGCTRSPFPDTSQRERKKYDRRLMLGSYLFLT